MFERLWEKLPFRRKLTRDRFARTLAKRLADSKGVGSVRYEPDQFRLFIDGEQYVNLSNFYAEHERLTPAERERHVENILQGIFLSGFQLPEDFEDAKHDLIAKIWPRAAFDRLSLQAEVDGNPPTTFAANSLGQHFYVGLVYDLPKSVRTVGHDELAKWNVTFDEALEVAIANLRKQPMKVDCLLPRESDEQAAPNAEDSFLPPQEYQPDGQTQSLPADGRVYFFVAEDSFDASRMVLIPDLQELETAGQPVAIAPNRDILMVAGAKDEAALTAMAAFASKMYTGEPRPHVPIPMTFADGAWEEFRVEPEHTAYADFHRLELQYMAEEYNEQKPLLEKLYAERYLKGSFLPRSVRDEEPYPQPPFVASLLVAEDSKGVVESHAVWAEDLDTLLPKADVIAFIRGAANSQPITIPWSDVMAVLDDLVDELPEHYPPRFQVRQFPSDLALNILTEDQTNDDSNDP